MALYSIGGQGPHVAASAFVAPGASLIGHVELGERASVWFGAVIRGDNAPIRIGDGSNIQEDAVLHADPGFPLDIAANVTVGHQAMLHGCLIGEGTLIGIQAVVLNGAVIGKNCLVGAGAIVTEKKVFPDRSLIFGAPAKVVRQLTDEDVARLQDSAANYAQRASTYGAELTLVG